MASSPDNIAALAALPQNQPEPETLLYFAFGSNLSSTQMRSRCPGAAAVGLAFLPGYDFIINERGFANVVPSNTTAPSCLLHFLWAQTNALFHEMSQGWETEMPKTITNDTPVTLLRRLR